MNRNTITEIVNQIVAEILPSHETSKNVEIKSIIDPRPIKMKDIDKKSKQKCNIENIQVHFPYEKIYEAQISYMRDVIKSLWQKKNAILQSPTGTGKTLSLLCASLAWLKHHRENSNPANNTISVNETRIIYATRTHAQCKQVVDQIKKTAYFPTVSILGSRDISCVKNKKGEFKNADGISVKLWGEVLSARCKKARALTANADKKKLNYQDRPNETEEERKFREEQEYLSTCPYYKPFIMGNNSQFHIQALPNVNVNTDQILDIEEMVELGGKCKFCPY